MKKLKKVERNLKKWEETKVRRKELKKESQKGRKLGMYKVRNK